MDVPPNDQGEAHLPRPPAFWLATTSTGQTLADRQNLAPPLLTLMSAAQNWG